MPDYDLIVAGGGPSGSSAAATAAKRGLRVLLLESGEHKRVKICGGLIPLAAFDLVREVFDSEIPDTVLSEPRSLGLFYVPPSGIVNGGKLRNYKVTNLDRSLFDEWLRIRAESFGVKIAYGARLVDFSGGEPIEVKIIYSNAVIENVSTSCLVGADGVFSDVRTRLYGRESRLMRVVQESWRKTRDIDDFYVILDGVLSSTYSYLIPKTETIEIGLSIRNEELNQYQSRIELLRTRLSSTLDLEFSNCVLRRLWAIPYGFTILGERNVLLVGDAAGLCNPLSGEGIRLGIESGEAAGSAIADAIEGRIDAISIYSDFASQLVQLVSRIYEYSYNFDDKEREKFVCAELNRISLS